MAEVKSPRVNERETRAEGFMTTALRPEDEPQKRIFLPLKCIRKKGAIFGSAGDGATYCGLGKRLK
jgi:hypothetical protein